MVASTAVKKHGWTITEFLKFLGALLLIMLVLFAGIMGPSLVDYSSTKKEEHCPARSMGSIQPNRSTGENIGLPER